MFDASAPTKLILTPVFKNEHTAAVAQAMPLTKFRCTSLLAAALPLLTAGAAGAAPPTQVTHPNQGDLPTHRGTPSAVEVELAPEDKAPQAETGKPLLGLGAGETPDHEFVRGLTAQRFRSAEGSAIRTSIGGYGEIHVRGTTRGRDGERSWTGDVARLGIFVAHPFNDKIRAYTEIEIEHAVACATCRGTVEIEQAYIDWKLFGDRVGLRAGLVLLPMGVINQWHEPPVFHGVVRPKVETVIIPSTWREIAIGAFGEPLPGLHYELYAMTGLGPLGVSAGGLAGARQNGALASVNAWAAVGRVEYEPLLGVVLGASGYASDAGANAPVYLRDRTRVNLSYPVLGFALDARFRRAGLEWKMLYAEFRTPESGALMGTFDAAGARLCLDRSSPMPTLVRGAYVEGAYDVLRLLGVSHQLLPFARIEYYDTQAEVPDDFSPNPTYSIREYTFGASYRPIQQLVFKADYQLRNRRLGKDETQMNFGVGFMY
jgi:hypothetical protein